MKIKGFYIRSHSLPLHIRGVQLFLSTYWPLGILKDLWGTSLARLLVGLSHYYWVISALQILGAAAGKSLCAACIGSAWTSDRKYSLYHLFMNPAGIVMAIVDPLVYCLRRQSPTLLRDFCATDV